MLANTAINSKGTENYPDPVIVDQERLIFVRYDKNNPASYCTPAYFPNDDVFNNKVITGIQCFKNFDAEDPASNPIQTDAGYIGQYFGDTFLRYFTLTLVGKNNEIIVQDLPLVTLATGGNFGKIKRFSCMINLSKCYIRNFGYNALTSTSVIPINFYYRSL